MSIPSVTLRIVPVDALITGVAFALVAVAMYMLASRHKSRAGFISSALFAYCGATLVARFVLFFTLFRPGHHAFESITSTWGFYLLLNGLRPYALVLAACCAIFLARSQTMGHDRA